MFPIFRSHTAGHLTSAHANFKRKLCVRNIFAAEMFQVSSNNRGGVLCLHSNVHMCGDDGKTQTPPRRQKNTPVTFSTKVDNRPTLPLLHYGIIVVLPLLRGCVSQPPYLYASNILLCCRRVERRCSPPPTSRGATSCFGSKTWSRVNVSLNPTSFVFA